MGKKNIREKLVKLEEILKTLEDSPEIDAIVAQIEKLDKQLESPIWKKIIKGIGIVSAIAGLGLIIIQIVLVFL